MAITQINKVESQVWNSDMSDFLDETTVPIIITETDYFSDPVDPITISLDAHGIYRIEGKLRVSQNKATVGTITLGLLGLDNTVSIDRIIETVYVVENADATGASDLILGCGVTNDTKRLQLYGRAQNLTTTMAIFITLDVHTTAGSLSTIPKIPQ